MAHIQQKKMKGLMDHLYIQKLCYHWDTCMTILYTVIRLFLFSSIARRVRKRAIMCEGERCMRRDENNEDVNDIPINIEEEVNIVD